MHTARHCLVRSFMMRFWPCCPHQQSGHSTARFRIQVQCLLPCTASGPSAGSAHVTCATQSSSGLQCSPSGTVWWDPQATSASFWCTPQQTNVGECSTAAEHSAHRHAQPGQVLQRLEHGLGAPLSDLSQADERCMPLPPVAALHEPRQEVDRQGKDGVASQGQGDSVQALLPNLKQVALALILCGFRVPTVPLGGVLQTRAQQSGGTQGRCTKTP